MKISKSFGQYARNYKVEIVDSTESLDLLESSKSSIKDLLYEIKGFKYQITATSSLKKHKENEGIEVAPVYFDFITKTVINLK